MVACLEAFGAAANSSLLIVARPAVKNAPFAPGVLGRAGTVLDRSRLGEHDIEKQLREFGPDAVLVSGWVDPIYNRVCKRLKAAGIPIVAGCDTQWRGSLRQRIAAFVSPWHVQKFIDVLWVPGNRQRQFAHALGFNGNRCWEGFYACDWERFATKSESSFNVRSRASSSNPSAIGHLPSSSFFLFVGRYVAAKGIHDLAEAYRIYRKEVRNPWPLVCAGKGDLGATLIDAGAEDRGFVQPEHLPKLMHQAAAFVLPSRFEPWGVVVQEAAAAGLPLIVSRACGAGDHLVQDGDNGFLTETGQPQSVAAALVRMYRLTADERRQFGRRSLELSKKYTPQLWARKLQDGLRNLTLPPSNRENGVRKKLHVRATPSGCQTVRGAP